MELPQERIQPAFLGGTIQELEDQHIPALSMRELPLWHLGTEPWLASVLMNTGFSVPQGQVDENTRAPCGEGLIDACPLGVWCSVAKSKVQQTGPHLQALGFFCIQDYLP